MLQEIDVSVHVEQESGMIWSKLKRSVEALLAPSVKEHLRLHITRYGPGVSVTRARAWLTWDGEEICNFSTIEWLMAYHALVAQMSSEDDAVNRAEELLTLRGVFSREDFVTAVEEYVSLSIDEAMHSSGAIVKALAMFDRRLGKRRLLAICFQETDAPFVRHCYQLRCKAEGIAIYA